MKKFFVNIIIAMLVAGGFTSCSDFLDKESDLTLSNEQIFSKFENTRGFLANVYTYLPDAFAGYTDADRYGASRDCMTDNAMPYWNGLYYHNILADSYDATNHTFAEKYWTSDTHGIRAANTFMENARESVIGNAVKSGDDNRLYDRSVAEARLIRAILHMDMVGWFGAIPIMDKVLTNEEAAAITRTPAVDALRWIANECDSVKDALPFRYANENENWGRVNGATAYALKSRALLYLASPLNNAGNSAALWQEAADAALEFITVNARQSNPYTLYTTSDNDPNQNYYQCFVSTPHLNNELILSRSEWTTYDVELNCAPAGFAGRVTAVGRTNPTQNLVDAYETINGLPIDQDPTYDASNPYANRDPRLEQTILHDGSIWGVAQSDEQRAVDTSYPNGADWQPALHGGTTTSYYTKKFVNNISFKDPQANPHACPIFRYAEILLNAAEALNEAGRTEQAYQYVNQVRARVGMPAYAGMTQQNLRERIQNERRVELCFEDHRFFDERRWKLFEGKTAASETNLPRYKQVYNIWSALITHDGDNVTYEYVHETRHATRGFNSPKNYYFPIPDEETKKARGLGQNTGWEVVSGSTDDDVLESE